MCRRPSPPIVRRPAARRVPRPGARPRSNPTEAASPYSPPDVGLVASAPRLTRPAAILGISAHGLIMRVDAKSMLADAGLASGAVSGGLACAQLNPVAMRHERSEERRVGKEGRSEGGGCDGKEKDGRGAVQVRRV